MNIIRTEQDGVEFFTIQATGESGMSESGLARLCDVTPQAITKLLKNLVTTYAGSECLKPFVGKEIHLQLRGLKNAKVIKDEVCAALIEHYAFESRSKNEKAMIAFRKFAAIGVRTWIQHINQWQANQSPPPPEQPQGIFPELKLNLPPLKTFEDACVFFFTAGEWLANAKATVSAYRLFFTVIENEAYGDRPSADELITEAKISKSSFYKSLKILKQAKLLPEWAKSDTRDFLEFRIRDRLKLELNGEIEVNTEVGLIDLLTPKEVIEIKAIQHWKTALGHVIAKGQVYPTHNKRIHLFGTSDLAIAKIRTYCSPLNVNVTFEKVTAEQIAV